MCECGLVETWCDHSAMPIRYVDEESKYFLLLKEDLSFPLSYCFGCGAGNLSVSELVVSDLHLDDSARKETSCTCKLVESWANDPDIPIEFSNEFGYFIMHLGIGNQQIRYCPSCGYSLIEDFLSKPLNTQTLNQIEELKRKINGVQTASEIINIFGTADGIPLNEYKSVEKGEAKRSLHYKSLAKNVSVHIFEFEDGTFEHLIFADQ